MTKRTTRTPRCPACRARDFFDREIPPLSSGHHFYGPAIRTCRRCGAQWEPEPEPVDRLAPLDAWSAPCDNCAFRPGSPELEDVAAWRATLDSLRAGGGFYCHKGVVIDPASEHGFRYPADATQLRLCRGFLNAVRAWEARDPAYSWIRRHFGIPDDPSLPSGGSAEPTREAP